MTSSARIPEDKFLLVSPPGTGKTTHCIELFKNEILKTRGGIESRSFFVLPSREHADRIQNLVLKKDLTGLFNVHILTINDLAAKLLGVSGKPRPTGPLRAAIVKKILEDIGQEKGLEYFEPVKALRGFHELLVDAIREFKTSLLSVREFERLSQGLLKDAVFRSKFRDFSLILKNYSKELERLGLEEPEEAIGSLLSREPAGRLADLVIFDGFYDFTRAQRRLIEALCRVSKRTVVTLTLPPEKSERPALFAYPRRTQIFLESIGFKPHGDFSQNHRTADRALTHLEKNIFSDAPQAHAGPQDSVAVFEAPSVRLEIEMIAREIKRLYRENQIHFSDICVILRKIAGTEGLIRSVFSDFEIPLHIHERKKLAAHGLAATLHRFLNLAQEDWRREDVFFVLKSSYLAPRVNFSDVLALESAASSGENIPEGRAAWRRLLADPRVLAGQKEPLKMLLDLESRLLGAAGVREFARAIFGWFDTLGVGPEDAEALHSLGNILKGAALYYEGSEKRAFQASAFARELQSSIESALFSSKVYGKNRVQVYDAVMALPKEYKVVFLAGLLEKTFPQAVTEDPIFKDAERRLLNREGVVLEERLWRVEGERYFFYMAASRAKEKLILTYPTHDAEDRPTLPSFFIEEVQKCFAAVSRKTKGPGGILPEAGEWETAGEVTRGLAQILFERRNGAPRVSDFSGWAPTIRRWRRETSFREIVEAGRRGEEAAIRDPRIREILKKKEETFSATKLETFVTCPFKYFAGRVLDLNEPIEGRENLEMGSLLHETLEAFYKELDARDRANPAFWEKESEIGGRLQKKLEGLMAESAFRNEPLYRRRLYAEKMKGILSLFVKRERELLAARGFLPSYFEWEFGLGGKTPPLILDGIRIGGKIDRIDVSPDGRGALVIDYKKSKRPETLKKKLAKGLELQLPIYILAARKLLGLDVMGGELRFLQTGTEEAILREKGPADEFEKILTDTEGAIRGAVARLKDADIAVRSKTCQHCPYDAVCRFETWRLVYGA
ncbi:MAG: exodeoxyribonuclease V subunit gamma [Candidatus Omnitrophica bacterium]|nr:exodeoxyribonuclease V subunit gamma [Candidatus Omnitrophota bacterium]